MVMLVLSRKTGETVRIGCDITLVVLDASGGRVRIGFAAPAQVRIVRQEIFDGLGEKFLPESWPEETNHAARNP
jgi:carbon storage regulator CsrA